MKTSIFAMLLTVLVVFPIHAQKGTPNKNKITEMLKNNRYSIVSVKDFDIPQGETVHFKKNLIADVDNCLY